MNYKIRKIKDTEYDILNDFLYEAIFIPDGVAAPDMSIIESPDLQVYVADFGKKDDWCLVAEADGMIVGAAWTRIMNDYGHVDDQTPSLAISLYKEYRGHGVGTALLESLLTELRDAGYQKVSLSVQKANYAYKMYQKAGFIIVSENQEEYIMINEL